MQNNQQESTQISRRNRTPEAFLFGPSIAYGVLTVSAGIFSPSGGGRGTINDAYCNAMVITFALGGAGAVADALMIRVSTRQDATSPVASDIIIMTSQAAGAVQIFPMFTQLYSVTAFAMNSTGTTYPTQVGYATCVVFC